MSSTIFINPVLTAAAAARSRSRSRSRTVSPSSAIYKDVPSSGRYTTHTQFTLKHRTQRNTPTQSNPKHTHTYTYTRTHIHISLLTYHQLTHPIYPSPPLFLGYGKTKAVSPPHQRWSPSTDPPPAFDAGPWKPNKRMNRTRTLISPYLITDHPI